MVHDQQAPPEPRPDQEGVLWLFLIVVLENLIALGIEVGNGGGGDPGEGADREEMWPGERLVVTLMIRL